MLFRAQREDPNQKTTWRSSLVSIAGPFSECREALRNGRVPCPVCGNPLSSRGFAPPLGKVRLSEAVERLVQLYAATGKKDEAAKWETELRKLKPKALPEKKP